MAYAVGYMTHGLIELVTDVAELPISGSTHGRLALSLRANTTVGFRPCEDDRNDETGGPGRWRVRRSAVPSVSAQALSTQFDLNHG